MATLRDMIDKPAQHPGMYVACMQAGGPGSGRHKMIWYKAMDLHDKVKNNERGNVSWKSYNLNALHSLLKQLPLSKSTLNNIAGLVKDSKYSYSQEWALHAIHNALMRVRKKL